MKILPLSIIAFIVAIVVVILGAYTRLVDAGLGCPDWPTCYGHLWVPLGDIEIARANEKFSATPVESDKTWPEQIHRIFASSLGLIILALLFVALRSKDAQKHSRTLGLLLSTLVVATMARIFFGHILDFFLLPLAMLYFVYIARLYFQEGSSSQPFKLVALVTGLVILQGWFGMWTVTLSLWPQVVTAHLLGGFATLTLLWLVIQRSAGFHWRVDASTRLKLRGLLPFAITALALVVIQITLGGWTTANYAALACPDFPTCHGLWWPKGDFNQGFNLLQRVGPNYLGGQLDNYARTAIHLSHRIGALFVAASILVFAFTCLRSGAPQAKRGCAILLAVLGIQILLGVTNVVGGLPLVVAVAHNACGAALLLCLVTFIHRIYGAKHN